MTQWLFINPHLFKVLLAPNTLTWTIFQPWQLMRDWLTLGSHQHICPSPSSHKDSDRHKRQCDLSGEALALDTLCREQGHWGRGRNNKTNSEHQSVFRCYNKVPKTTKIQRTGGSGLTVWSLGHPMAWHRNLEKPSGFITRQSRVPHGMTDLVFHLKHVFLFIKSH